MDLRCRQHGGSIATLLGGPVPHLVPPPSRFPAHARTRSIDKWHKSGTFCPMCHAKLPPKLLRLFFDPKQSTGDDPNCGAVHPGTAVSCGSASDPTERSAAWGGREGRAGEASADVVRLRRELASITKVSTGTLTRGLWYLQQEPTAWCVLSGGEEALRVRCMCVLLP